MEIITGYTGVGHVTSAQAGATNTMLYGADKLVLNVGSKMAATKKSDNAVTIADGYGINQGRFFCVSEAEDVTIETGTSEKLREDAIVARYLKDDTTGVESITLAVVTGTAGDSYTAPTIASGNILTGATADDMLLYYVKINGTEIESIEAQFTVTDAIHTKVDAVTDHIDDTLQPYVDQAKKYRDEAETFAPEGYEELEATVEGFKTSKVNVSDIATSYVDDDTKVASAKTVKSLNDTLGTKQDKLTFDTTPTSASTNPVTSGGVYSALGDKVNTSDIATDYEDDDSKVASASSVKSLNDTLEVLETLAKTEYNISDLDSLDTNCTFSMYGNRTFGGSSNWALGRNIVLYINGVANTKYKAQEVMNIEIGTIYVRRCYNGTWSSWTQISTT